MKRKTILIFLTTILLLALGAFATYTLSQPSKFTLETERHWETYLTGGTCIHGSHNLFMTDVDGDNTIEAITGGLRYTIANGSRITLEAPLKIWSWNGQNLTLEKSHKWTGNIECIHAADADNDGATEILTAGYEINSTGNSTALKIWNCNGKELSLKASFEGSPFDSIFVSDLDNDSTPEIIAVGKTQWIHGASSQLQVFHLQQNTLTLQSEPQKVVTNATSANSVYAHDLNNDNQIEIITAGYANNLENSSGQLRIWHWNKEKLTLEASEEWRLAEGYGLTIAGGVQGNTVVNNVKVGDVDGDGVPEIVTGGFAFDGEKVAAQLRIWTWNGENLSLEKSEEWTTDYLNEVKCISLNDVNGDSRTEIVTSGIVAAYGSFASNETTPNTAQIRIWSWDGTTLTLNQNQEYTIGDGVCAWNVGTGDLDSDGTVEIITVGCMGINNLCDPDMRIWSITAPPPTEFIIATVTSVAVIGVASMYLFARKPN